MSPENMFRGKHLPSFLEQQAPLYRQLVEQHGLEKVVKVYDYFFAFMSRMIWGQWMVLDKVCPDVQMRQLFYWVVECIYQSDLISQFCFEYHDLPSDPSRREVRIVCVEPTADQLKRWRPFLPMMSTDQFSRRYSLIDWYGRLRQDPKSLPDVDPSWLMLEGGSDEAEGDPVVCDDDV